jgi:hypothetical protein
MKTNSNVALVILLSILGTGTIFVPMFDVPNEPPELGLKLMATLKGDTNVKSGEQPWVEVELVNSARFTTYQVVQPGHGSEIRNREPYITWTAEIDRGDGSWIPLTEQLQRGYCGTCLASSSNWLKDVITLRPGNGIAVDIPEKFHFQQTGRVRLTAHYEFGGCVKALERGYYPSELAKLNNIPAYKLKSKPIEFNVIRPLDLRIRVKGSLKRNVKTPLSELVDVVLVNASEQPIECSSPTWHADARGVVGFDGPFSGKVQYPSDSEMGKYGITIKLMPGEEVNMIGKGKFANGLEPIIEWNNGDHLLIRAAYTTSTWRPGRTIHSDIATIPISK